MDDPMGKMATTIPDVSLELSGSHQVAFKTVGRRGMAFFLWEAVYHRTDFTLKNWGAYRGKFQLSGKSRWVVLLSKRGTTLWMLAQLSADFPRPLLGHLMPEGPGGTCGPSAPPGHSIRLQLLGMCCGKSSCTSWGSRHMCFRSGLAESASEALISCHSACTFLLSHLTSYIFWNSSHITKGNSCGPTACL